MKIYFTIRSYSKRLSRYLLYLYLRILKTTKKKYDMALEKNNKNARFANSIPYAKPI